MRIGFPGAVIAACVIAAGYGQSTLAAAPQNKKAATAVKAPARKPATTAKPGATTRPAARKPAPVAVKKPAPRAQAGQSSHAAVVAVPPGAQAIHGLNWYSVSAGLAAAKKQNKPIVVDFYTDWCGWCKVMEEKTFQNPPVKTLMSKEFVLIRANAEDGADGQKLSSMLGVTGLPTTLIMDASGKPRDFKRGFVPPDKFLPFLQGYLSGKPVGDSVPAAANPAADGQPPGTGAAQDGTPGGGTPANPFRE